MAGVQSLGLHEPSAVSYLVSEGLLPVNPPASLYRWDYQKVKEESSSVVDEVLRTSDCVVWSRNGIVKRVFNLDIEGEAVTHAFTTTFGSGSDSSLFDASAIDHLADQRVRALVVILNTQAHIFLLSGATHVIPLSFEVEKAIPAAYGFILQRRVSSFIPKDGASPSESGVSTGTLLSPDSAEQRAHPQNRRHSSSRLPQPIRTFAFPQLLSELSLVVSGSSRRYEPFDECPLLSVDEDIAYISTDDELSELHMEGSEDVHLAVTTNLKTETLTLWQISFAFQHRDDTTHRRESVKIGMTSKRKSSNVYGRQTGTATPTIRGQGALRESLGALPQSITESGMFSLGREPVTHSMGDLAVQLGHEFEQTGVQTRSARRVSSMLARTDLGGANDRSAFNEMSAGPLGRKSFGRSTRRGESLGGFSDRQSFGLRRRSSFQAGSSIYSDGTSFLDIPASHLLDDGAAQPGADILEEMSDSRANNRLPRAVAFMKLKSLPYAATTTSDNRSQPVKVMTMVAPDRSTADDRRNRIISVCIMDRNKQEMTIVNIAAKVALATSRYKGNRISYDLKAVEVQRGQSIADACDVMDSSAKRLLILTHTREGRSALHLEAPWSVSYRINIPTQFKVFNILNSVRGDSPASRRDTGIHRIIPDSEVEIVSLRRGEAENNVLVYDSEQRCHQLRVELLPTQPLVRRVLQLCAFVLAPEFSESLLVAWWEVKRWIEVQGPDPDIEWTALVVTLFMLAVPFISNLQSKPAPGSRRKKGGLLRSSSGATVDLSNWDSMQEIEANSAFRPCIETPAWSWVPVPTRSRPEPKSPSKHRRGVSDDVGAQDNLDLFLVRCTNLARDFLQSPAGENATGPEGYLPTAVNKERTTRRTALASILVGLHLLREEHKLYEIGSSPTARSSGDLACVIVQIASWLDWKEWSLQPNQYYYLEVSSPAHLTTEGSVIDTLDTPAQPFEPPSIFAHIEGCILNNTDARFPCILDLLSQSRPITQTNPLWKQAAEITPRLFAFTTFIAQLRQRKPARSIVKYMTKCGIDSHVLETLPIGIASICHQAIITVRGQSQIDWSAESRKLLGRVELNPGPRVGDQRPGLNHVSHSHEAVRDFHTMCNNAIDADSLTRWDAHSEVDRQTVTRLIFHEDRRFQEASKLVNQTRPPTVECVPEPGWSEADLLEAQKEIAVHVTRRTLSVSAGRAMMHFNARVPLLTERVPIPAFSLQCVMKIGGNNDDSPSMTLSADKALFTEDKVCWAFFHNGASAGLMISKDTRWIDTSWILYNKPPELTNRHAGFLLALGLNGHLKSLAKWVAFKYLTPKHTMTSVGLLLGLAVSYLGTMDTLIARLLSVHVTRLLPVGAAELNLSPLTQTTGLLGVGLLYCNSQHRRMTEIMLSEIENSESEERTGDEPLLRDEGYRLAAGFSLGLINLGQGKKLHSLHDMNAIERLLTIAVGAKNVNFVHVLDRATAGAVIAVAFVYLKTNDEAIARKIDIPDTTHQFDYVRPDIFLLRTLARHLIMWDRITPSAAFVRQSLPSAFRRRAELSTTKRLSTDDLPFFNVITGIYFAMSLRFAGTHRSDVRNLLVSCLDQFLRLAKLPALNYDAKVTLNGVRNCLDVVALSCAIVMAGSGDIIVMRRLRALHGRTDKETPFGSHLAAHMALGILFLSGGTATFGTSDLAVAALVISLYPLFPVDVLDNKCHLQALRHLWVLAVENRCLVARDVETQQVVSDIQAEIVLRDGTKQKVNSPGLLPDFDRIERINFRHDSYWPVSVDFDGPAKSDKQSMKHQDVGKPNAISLREQLKESGTGVTVHLQRRVAYEKADSSVFFSELQALQEGRGVPSVDVNSSVNEKWRQAHGSAVSTETVRHRDPFDWVFELEALKHLDFAEKALVLGESGNHTGSGRDMLGETAIDSKLGFEFGCLEADANDDHGDRSLPRRMTNRDRLWQLRLLFAWADRLDVEEAETDSASGHELSPAQERGTTRWIRKETVELLRWKVWKMAGGEGA